jgi:hypothetical protein
MNIGKAYDKDKIDEVAKAFEDFRIANGISLPLQKAKGLHRSTPKALRSSAFGYPNGVPWGTPMWVQIYKIAPYVEYPTYFA